MNVLNRIELLAKDRVVERILSSYGCSPSVLPDVAQDIYLYLLTNADVYADWCDRGLDRPYLRKICSNQIATRWRDSHKVVQISMDEVPMDIVDESTCED